MAKHASRAAAPLQPDPPDGEAFLEIDGAEFEEARRDPVVRQFAQRAETALREAEQRGEITLPD
ncbi:MAG TPA: hypothetical protein VGW10_10880 [Solirubrobacteraceae bacterium]|nr:hypothetical protein [Solirubrobacteraceae bacterium]